MATMKRGANVALTREIPGLRGVVVGVTWDAGSESVLDQSLVFATLLCDASSKVLSDAHFVFFNQLSSPDQSVQRLEAALGRDREQVEVHFADVPADVERIVFAVYINDGPGPRRTLRQLRSLVVRVLNLDGNAELVSSEDLASALDTETALTVAEVYRLGADWKFKVLGQGYGQGISGIAADYGVPL